MSDDDISVKFGAENDEAISALNQVRFAIEGLSNPLRAVRTTMGEVGEAFVAAFAVEQLTSFTEQMGELGLETEKLTEQLGLSAKEVTEFESATGQVGVSGEAAGMAIERMYRGLSQTSQAGSPAQQAMAALGVTFKDVHTGAILPLSTLLPQLADKFASFADGPNKTALAMDLFGRSGAQLIPILDKGASGLQDLYSAADAAGVVLSDQATAGMVAVHNALYELDEEIKGASITAFNDFQPTILGVVTQLNEFINQSRQTITNSVELRGVWAALVNPTDALKNSVVSLWGAFVELNDHLGILAEVWREVKFAFQEFLALFDYAIAATIGFVGWVELLINALEQFGDEARAVTIAVYDALNDLVHGRMSSLNADWERDMQAWEDVIKTHAERGKAIFAQTMAEIEQGLNQNGPLPWFKTPPDLSKPPDINIAKPTAPGTTPLNADSQAKKQEAEQFIQFENTKRQALQETASFSASMAQLALDQQKSMLQQELNEGLITKQQYFQRLAALQSQQTSTDLAALNQQYQDVVKVNAEELANNALTLQQKVKLNQQASEEVIKIIDKEVLALQKGLNAQTADVTSALAEQESAWKRYDTQIVGGIGGAFQNMLTSTKTWQQQMISIFDQMLGFFIKMAEQQVVKWVLTEQMKTAATVVGNAQRTASDVGAATAGAAADKEASLGSILRHAYSAAAAVWDDVAQIPYVGWLLAPPAAAAAFTAVAAFGGSLPSAAGGMVVDNDTLAQIHQDEMVLPANLSKGIQDIINSGSTSGGDHYEINISAVDAASVQRLFLNNSNSIVSAIATAKRNMNPQLGMNPT